MTSTTTDRVILTPDMDVKVALGYVASSKVDMAAYLEWDAARIKRAAAGAKRIGQLSVKVSGKGGISVYGLQRMPVTLYAEQWAKLFAFREQVEGFIAEHKGELSFKATPQS